MTMLPIIVLSFLLLVQCSIDPKILKFIEEETKKYAQKEGIDVEIEQKIFDEILNPSEDELIDPHLKPLVTSSNALRDIIQEQADKLKICAEAFANTAKLFTKLYNRKLVWGSPDEFLKQAADVKEITTDVISCYSGGLTQITESVNMGIETLTVLGKQISDAVKDVENKREALKNSKSGKDTDKDL